MKMFKEMKRRAAKNMILPIVICVILGGIFIGLGARHSLMLLKGAKDITNASVKEIRNTDYAEIELDKYNLYGCFSEEYKTSNGNKITDAYYYLVLVGDDSDKRFMAVKVNAKDYSKLMKIEQEYTDLDNGVESDERTILKVKGEVTKMKGDVYTHFKSTMQTYDYTEDDIPFITLNLIVDNSSISLAELVFTALGVLIIIIPILMIIYALSIGSVRKLEKELNSKGMGYLEKVENDYMNSEKFGNNLRIGKHFTFVIKGLKNVVIPNEEIIWAYNAKTTHRTNGIKTGTTFAIVIVNVEKKTFNANMKNENTANAVLALYASLTDTIVLGYDVQFKIMINSNLEEFLNITYRNHIYGEKVDSVQ